MPGLRSLWPLCLGLTFFAGCSDLTAPREERVTVLPEPPPPATARPAVEAASAQPPPTPPPAPAPEVAHVLVAYKGAKNAPAKAAARTKEQARKMAEDVAKRAAKDDFAGLAKRMSDDVATAAKGGSMGALSASTAPKALFDAASALAPGGVSPVVETEEGFHVLKRPAPPTTGAANGGGNGAHPAHADLPKNGPAPRQAGHAAAPHPPPRPQNPAPRPRAPGQR